MLPFGILEKHGPHLPIGTDLLDVRFAVMNAVKQEYAVVFPEYYFGQIFEARHQPGTVAYSLSTQLTLLQETVSEMARNGCKKVRHRQRPRRQQQPAAALRTGTARQPARLRGLRLRIAASRRAGPPALKTPMDMHAGEVGDLAHAHRAARPRPSSIAPPSSRARTRTATRCRTRSTPASGGMRVSPITMRARARRQPRNWASSIRRSGRARLPKPSKPSKPTPPASSCKTSSTRKRSTRWTRSSRACGNRHDYHLAMQ